MLSTWILINGCSGKFFAIRRKTESNWNTESTRIGIEAVHCRLFVFSSLFEACLFVVFLFFIFLRIKTFFLYLAQPKFLLVPTRRYLICCINDIWITYTIENSKGQCCLIFFFLSWKIIVVNYFFLRISPWKLYTKTPPHSRKNFCFQVRLQKAPFPWK